MKESYRHIHIGIAVCNRVGQEGEVTFAGQSLLAAPNGDLLTVGRSCWCWKRRWNRWHRNEKSARGSGYERPER